MYTWSRDDVILEAIVGSVAYGLDTPTSDEDFLGIFVMDTAHLIGLFHNSHQDTHHTTAPDTTYHEVGKYIGLALQCNPTVLELLWAGDERPYVYKHAIADLLIKNRRAFLSTQVRKSYGGYAMAQMRRLETREAEGKVGFDPDLTKRRAKHARHLMRLVQQGRQLLETGELTLRVPNRDELFEIGELPTPELKERFEAALVGMDAIDTKLPDEPDHQRANDLLLSIRHQWEERGSSI